LPIVVLAFALLSGATRAASFTEADAVRIGRAADIQGLRALIAQHDYNLLARATNSWNLGEARTLPDSLEALIIEHYGDRVASAPLRGLLARRLDNFERFPKYRSRKLFDLLYADLKVRTSEREIYAMQITATDLPVEAELIALLPLLNPASANELVMFLGRRRYAPALPALQALQARVTPDKDENAMTSRVDWAYLQIGTPPALAAFMARLRAFAQDPSDRGGYGAATMLSYVSQQPASSAPGYAELRAALPDELNPHAWDALVQLIVQRREKRGIPDLLRAVARTPRAEQAVDALLALGGPQDWQAARAELARATDRLPAERIATLQKRFDGPLADPAKYAAQRDQREQSDAFAKESNRIAALRTTDRARYVSELRALLKRREAELASLGDAPQSVGARQDLVREHTHLATVLRFELRQPDEAIATLQEARRLATREGVDVASFAIADIQRFDKRDMPKALAAYRQVLASLDAPATRSSGETRMLAAFRTSVEKEIAYVERGRRFSGPIGRADIAAMQMWLLIAAQYSPSDARLQPDALSKLPPSQLQLARAYPAVLNLAPEEMLGFFAKHDPAGYISAALLSAALANDPSPYVKAAAEIFFREHGVRAALAPKPQPRYATPEKTWETFMAATRKGDVTAMLDCLTPDMQDKFGRLFKAMSREDLRRMADSVVGFGMQSVYGEFREALVIRQQDDRKMGAAVTFVNDGGDWKITEM
jgi:hypothetical protein